MLRGLLEFLVPSLPKAHAISLFLPSTMVFFFLVAPAMYMRVEVSACLSDAV